MPKKSPKVEYEDVYPLYEFDSNRPVGKMQMAWLFHLDALLAPEVLRASLSRLLQIGDWRKFAGRFHRNGQGNLELRTPRTFPADYAIIGYSHRDLSHQKASDHELARQIPVGKLTTSSFDDQPMYDELLYHKHKISPSETIDTWIREQLPPLALHITTFADATTVSLLWRHNVGDAGGMSALVSTWSLVLSGQESSVPKLLGTGENVLWKVGDTRNVKPGDWCMSDKALSTRALIKMVMRVILKRQFTAPEFQTRNICVPAANIDRLKERCLKKLDMVSVKRPERLGGSLLIRALLLKLAIQTEPKVRYVSFILPVNSRRQLFENQKEEGVYVQNMLSYVFVSLPVEIVRGPLATLAMEIGRQTQEQTTTSQVAAFFTYRWAEEKKGTSQAKLAYFSEHPGKDFPVAYNDLSSLDIRGKIDFSPAAVNQADLVAKAPEGGTPKFFCQATIGESKVSPKTLRIPKVVCSGKDAFGNYLLSVTLSKKTWGILQEELGSDQPI